MFTPRINYIAIVTCVVFQFVFGLFWYSPWLFNDAWFQYAQLGHDAFDNYGLNPYLFFIAYIFTSTYALAWIIMKTHTINAGSGAKIGFMMWLFFAAPAIFACNALKGYVFELSFIESGVHFVNFLVAGSVLGSWRRRR